jgi:predicted MFS family arabinose efflux permease
LWTSAIALVFVGWLYGYAFTSFAGTSQQLAPDDMRGRVLAVNFLVLGLMYPIGSLVQGPIADAIGLRWTTASSGICLALSMAIVIPVHLRARSRAAQFA